ncbi:MAG: lysophospholipid acyltransferase family protein [Clostridia bacterium]|nr:lysophospholipid acyltransferase family protein [Clostridia bacterium]
MSNRFYTIARAIVRVLFMIFSPIRVTGAENIPQDGSAILAANHKSLMDPIKIVCAVDRQVNFMAKKELFDIWGLRSMLKALGAFPVDRSGSDFSSVKLAISILNEGRLFGIFPQGKREFKGGKEFKNGVSLIAAKSAAPVIPVYIDRRTGFFRATRIAFGKSVPLGDILKRPTSAALSEATSAIEKAVYALAKTDAAPK